AELAALQRRTLHPDLAAVTLDDHTGDRQSQAHTSDRAGIFFVGLVAAVQPVVEVDRLPVAGVADEDSDRGLALCAANLQAPTLDGASGRNPDQVFDHLAQPIGIAGNRRHAFS